MNLNYYYWYFKSALTPRFCDEVIKYGLSHQDKLARTGSFTDKELTADEIKISDKNALKQILFKVFIINYSNLL